VDRAVPRFDRAHRPAADYEVLAVDDTSSDDTVAIVRSQFPEVRVSRMRRIWDFGKTVNVG